MDKSDNFSPLAIVLSVPGELSLSFFLGGSFSFSFSSSVWSGCCTSLVTRARHKFPTFSTALEFPLRTSLHGISRPPWGRSSE